MHALLSHVTTLTRRLTLLAQVSLKVLLVSLAPQVVLKMSLPVEPHVADVARYSLIRLQAIDAGHGLR